MMTYKVCLYHLLRPHAKDFSILDGWGDCTTCEPDLENNPNCRGYIPIYLRIIGSEGYKNEDLELLRERWG